MVAREDFQGAKDLVSEEEVRAEAGEVASGCSGGDIEIARFQLVRCVCARERSTSWSYDVLTQECPYLASSPYWDSKDIAERRVVAVIQ